MAQPVVTQTKTIANKAMPARHRLDDNNSETRRIDGWFREPEEIGLMMK